VLHQNSKSGKVKSRDGNVNVGWSKRTVAHPASAHASRRAHGDSETPNKLDRPPARALRSEVAGTRGKGTGGRKSYIPLKNRNPKPLTLNPKP
jgi:hypothetical protein